MNEKDFEIGKEFFVYSKSGVMVGRGPVIEVVKEEQGYSVTIKNLYKKRLKETYGASLFRFTPVQ